MADLQRTNYAALMGHFHASQLADVFADTVVRSAAKPSAFRHGSRRSGKPFEYRADLEVRRILLLVCEFRELCELEFEPHRLVNVLRAVIESGRAGSERPSILNSEAISDFGVDIRDDASKCLRDLDELLRALCVGAAPSADELAHAMDPLIMLCVQIDAAAK